MDKGFRSLITWQKAYHLGLEVYKLTKSFPSDEKFGLTSQLRRASVSISANIAEGYERQHKKEYVQFLSIAKGSLGEVETYLLFAKDLGYFQNSQFQSLDAQREEVGRLLKGLIRSI